MAFLKDMSLTLGKSLESTRDSEKFLQEIIDGIAEPIMLIDLDYRVLLMNRTARQTSKLSPGEGAGLNCYQVSHGSEEPCGGEDHLCPLEQVRKTGKKITVQHIHDSLAGKRVIEIVASPLFDSQGGLKGIIEAGRDITKRKRIEEELLKANSELEKRYRELQVVDEVKNNLIRDVSHELKTPVAKHSMQLEILRPLMEKHSLTGEEAKAFSVMEDSIRRQEDVIRNLLDLSRLESGRQRYHIAPLRLDELLERVRSDYLYAVEQCGGSVNCSVSSVVVNSDSDMLWHLFSNLLNNAIKFRKAGRPVRVDITAEVADGAVKVLLTDDGLGLSEQEKKMVFERFYQTTASSEGSGVGLTICRMIAEDLGGKVELRSEGKERGTTAVVTLPLAEDSLSA
jgi:PAS domain S-box-containing protein